MILDYPSGFSPLPVIPSSRTPSRLFMDVFFSISRRWRTSIWWSSVDRVYGVFLEFALLISLYPYVGSWIHLWNVDIGRNLDSVGPGLSSGHGDTCILDISLTEVGEEATYLISTSRLFGRSLLSQGNSRVDLSYIISLVRNQEGQTHRGNRLQRSWDRWSSRIPRNGR